MSASGKDLRLRHLLHRETGTCILFAASHGTSTATLFHELDQTAGKVAAAIDGGADSVLISPPIARLCCGIFRQRPHAGFVAKVSATAFEASRRETPIWSVEAATIAGADGIGIMMQLTPENEESVISLVADYGQECERLGMPYVVEAELPGAYQTNDWMPDDPVRYLRRSCRLAEELGADIIKTNWPGSADGFASVISAVTRPVIVAGGPRIQDSQLLEIIDQAMQAGAIGASVGRNIFQAPDPVQATANIAAVVHERAPVSRILAGSVN
jgi:fructose-bisphosphate aldolase / 2-amino-3,7-dideoxy-D-threo-hept-6-ulosonate synthase